MSERVMRWKRWRTWQQLENSREKEESGQERNISVDWPSGVKNDKHLNWSETPGLAQFGEKYDRQRYSARHVMFVTVQPDDVIFMLIWLPTRPGVKSTN